MLTFTKYKSAKEKLYNFLDTCTPYHYNGDVHKLIPVTSVDDIPTSYKNTPIQVLFECHNFGKTIDQEYAQAQMLIGMCMDNRKRLKIPHNFAFIIRTGGANLRQSEFKISYAIAVGGVRCFALIGHTQCGMVNLHERKKLFTDGLIDAGWDPKAAEDHFDSYAPIHEIRNETDFILNETRRFRTRYPNVLVAPILYRVEDNALYLIDESKKPTKKQIREAFTTATATSLQNVRRPYSPAPSYRRLPSS